MHLILIGHKILALLVCLFFLLLRFKYSTVLKHEILIFCFEQMGLFFICTHFKMVKNDSRPSKSIVCPIK